jgi:hypothetical protein
MIFGVECQGNIVGNTELGIELTMEISLLIMKCRFASAALIIQSPEEAKVI